MYINYRSVHGIETIEDLNGLTRLERKALIKEYHLIDSNYYISQRATKEYYTSNKDK